jgi:hypothetical protein
LRIGPSQTYFPPPIRNNQARATQALIHYETILT